MKWELELVQPIKQFISICLATDIEFRKRFVAWNIYFNSLQFMWHDYDLMSFPGKECITYDWQNISGARDLAARCRARRLYNKYSQWCEMHFVTLSFGDAFIQILIGQTRKVRRDVCTWIINHNRQCVGRIWLFLHNCVNIALFWRQANPLFRTHYNGIIS